MPRCWNVMEINQSVAALLTHVHVSDLYIIVVYCQTRVCTINYALCICVFTIVS